jgi:hypothetical protein
MALNVAFSVVSMLTTLGLRCRDDVSGKRRIFNFLESALKKALQASENSKLSSLPTIR